jgi:hypothetical protein
MFRLGERGQTGYLLDAERVGPEKEFIFNGLLFVNGVSEAGTVIDSFPKAPPPKGWVKRIRLDETGYELVDPQSRTVLFGYTVLQNAYHVTTNIYDEHGRLVAESRGSEFLGTVVPLLSARAAS